jgi:hypothetical protein
LRRKILFLGSWAPEVVVSKIGKAWVGRLAELLSINFDCQIAEPPLTTEELDCRGNWFNPTARTDEARVKILRKQVFTGLVAMLQHAVRWRPDRVWTGGGSRRPVCLTAGGRSGVPDKGYPFRSNEGV